MCSACTNIFKGSSNKNIRIRIFVRLMMLLLVTQLADKASHGALEVWSLWNRETVSPRFSTPQVSGSHVHGYPSKQLLSGYSGFPVGVCGKTESLFGFGLKKNLFRTHGRTHARTHRHKGDFILCPQTKIKEP